MEHIKCMSETQEHLDIAITCIKKDGAILGFFNQKSIWHSMKTWHKLPPDIV